MKSSYSALQLGSIALAFGICSFPFAAVKAAGQTALPPLPAADPSCSTSRDYSFYACRRAGACRSDHRL